MEQKLGQKNKKRSKFLPLQRKPGLNNTQFGYGHNSQSE